MGTGSYNNAKLIWFDENIDNDQNKTYFKKLKSLSNQTKVYKSLDKGFENFYGKRREDEFQIKIVIVSGRLFGRYIQKIKDNINKIVNIPYTYIFTSNNFKKILLREQLDKEHELSFDTMIAVDDGFYNPGGVFSDFYDLSEDENEKNGIK